MNYWKFDPEAMTMVYTFVREPHYPVRIEPEKWPDMKWIGKAMARGWLVPCRYYPIWRGRGKFSMRSYIFPGVPSAEYLRILAVMRQKEL